MNTCDMLKTVVHKRKYDRATNCDQLHSLPVRQRIEYKLGTIVYIDQYPEYLAGLCILWTQICTAVVCVRLHMVN